MYVTARTTRSYVYWCVLYDVLYHRSILCTSLNINIPISCLFHVYSKLKCRTQTQRGTQTVHSNTQENGRESFNRNDRMHWQNDFESLPYKHPTTPSYLSAEHPVDLGHLGCRDNLYKSLRTVQYSQPI